MSVCTYFIGGTGKSTDYDRHPKLGNNVFVGCQATILGMLRMMMTMSMMMVMVTMMSMMIMIMMMMMLYDDDDYDDDVVVV